MKAAALLLWFASAAAAQTTLWIDLTGDWRLSLDDRPEYASPAFDDSAWRTLALPRAGEYFQGIKYWMRRSVELPQGTDRAQLALTLGALQDVYEVYVNGHRIGASGSFDSFEDSQIPRPRTFAIPAEAARAGQTLQIALRVTSVLFYHPHLRLWDRGPYLLTDRAHAPIDAGRQQLESRWIQFSPHMVFGAVFAVIGVLSLLGWLSERERTDLLWFALVSFARAFASFNLLFQLLSDSHPFNRSGLAWEFAYGNLDVPLFVEFAFAALGVRSWKLRWALWLGWAGVPLSLFLAKYGAVWFLGFPSMLWAASLGLVVIAWNWWRLSRTRASMEQHVLCLVLFLHAFAGCNVWLYFIRSNSVAQSRSLAVFEAQAIPAFAVGPYHVQFDDIFWLLVSATILTLLFRRLAADRRERQRLSSELEAARVIQQLLLEKPELREPGLSLEAVYAPALEVGGDFYYVLDGQVVVLGDVSGKGLKAAMLVSLLIGVLRDTCERQPALVLAAMNRAVAGHIDGFVTCCCARFDAAGAVTIASAGHPSPYLDGLEATIETGLPLGLDPHVSYAETALTLAPKASLTLLSDGVVEASNSTGELLGFDRTRALSAKSATAIAEAAKAWGQNDDITVVTVRRTEVVA